MSPPKRGAVLSAAASGQPARQWDGAAVQRVEVTHDEVREVWISLAGHFYAGLSSAYLPLPRGSAVSEMTQDESHQ